MRFTEDTGWDAFVASLDPVKLERERMRRPALSERPGSAADRLMREQHELRLRRLRARRVRVAAALLEAGLAESSEFDAGSGMVMSQLAAYRERTRKKAS